MAVKVVYTCPLGSTCEKIVGNEIHRCAWYTEVMGTNPQTGEPLNQTKCAIAWMPILQIETAMTNRGQTEAICSLRDETAKRQQEALIKLTGQLNGKEISSDS